MLIDCWALLIQDMLNPAIDQLPKILMMVIKAKGVHAHVEFHQKNVSEIANKSINTNSKQSDISCVMWIIHGKCHIGSTYKFHKNLSISYVMYDIHMDANIISL